MLIGTASTSFIRLCTYRRGRRARRLPPDVAGGVVEAVGPRIQISPVASELTYNFPVPSRNRPAGLKQAVGHCVLSGLVKRSTAAVRLSAAATGWPLAKSIVATLYPTGIGLFLHQRIRIVLLIYKGVLTSSRGRKRMLCFHRQQT